MLAVAKSCQSWTTFMPDEETQSSSELIALIGIKQVPTVT
jgi:hypothetical protein